MKNIIDTVLAVATTSEIIEGMRWYENASKFIKSLDVDFFKGCGILSALSPRNKWERNKQDCISILRYGPAATVATFNSNKNKALSILHCNTYEEIRQILKGRKVMSFYNNITHYSIPSTITVDVWMYRLFNLLPNDRNYDLIESVIKTHALHVGILPHQLQAILWVVTRRLHASDYDFKKLSGGVDLFREHTNNETIISP